MSTRNHRCIRCGIDVYARDAVCVDCLSVDHAVIASWRAEPAA